MRYDKTPAYSTEQQTKDWERGYDQGYHDGLNRYEEKYHDTDTKAYQ